MIDCHCHLLPGIDDGPESLTEAVEMARMLARYGFSTVHCTPHCIGGLYDNTPNLIAGRVRELQQALDQADIPISLRPGMEYYLDNRFPEQLADLQPLGASRLLLVEAPAWAGSDLIVENLRQIVACGYTPLFAHPERCRLIAPPGRGGLWGKTRRLFGVGELPHEEDLLSRLIRLGCLFQGNLGSFAGRYGKPVKKRAEALLASGLYSCIGSDSHPLPGLEEMIACGLERVRLLTEDHEPLLEANRLLF